MTHFLGAEGWHGMVQGAVVMRSGNGGGGCPRRCEEDDAQVGRIETQG
jgi:hypothetical protein